MLNRVNRRVNAINPAALTETSQKQSLDRLRTKTFKTETTLLTFCISKLLNFLKFSILSYKHKRTDAQTDRQTV